MTAQNIKSQNDISTSFKKEQYKLFVFRTENFIKEGFPSLVATLTEQELVAIVEAVQKRGQRSDFLTERNIWHYTVFCIYLGIFFDVDPQYAQYLEQYHWEDGSIDVRIANMYDFMKFFVPSIGDDHGPFHEKINQLSNYYQELTMNRTLERADPVKQANDFLAVFFERRWSLLSSDEQLATINNNLDIAKKLNLSANNSIMYTVAAVYFGYGFHLSPIFPWAKCLSETTHRRTRTHKAIFGRRI
ncbi:hypothetical protein [Bartonella sp. HY038]|uniref:hypothetical protein n=1 Tax=Bartonella sp. HY038 TaxID=2759660 RepID=UPI0015FA7919|nr:hypothetical protein [Bartonella sp. HY038]